MPVCASGECAGSAHTVSPQIALSEREAYFQAEAAQWRPKYETHKGDFSQLHKIVESKLVALDAWLACID